MKSRGKCQRCGKEASYWELSRYNGICAACFAREVNLKKKKPEL